MCLVGLGLKKERGSSCKAAGGGVARGTPSPRPSPKSGPQTLATEPHWSRSRRGPARKLCGNRDVLQAAPQGKPGRSRWGQEGASAAEASAGDPPGSPGVRFLCRKLFPKTGQGSSLGAEGLGSSPQGTAY